jgi:hypothetical protein
MEAIGRSNSFGKSEPKPPVPIDTVAVGSWNVGGKDVTVFRKESSLVFETLDESKPLNLKDFYGMQQSVKLVEIFHDVIQSNLEDGIGETAFLPFLRTQGFVEKELNGRGKCEPLNMQVVLFGNTSSGPTNMVGGRWGVFNFSKKEITHFPIDDSSGEALNFLRRVPTSSKEKYESYVKQFKPVMNIDDDGKVGSIALKFISLYDPKVVLDEERWAITVLSTKTPTVAGCCNTGHAVIVFEGLIDGHPLFQRAHITTIHSRTGSDKDRKPNEARASIRGPRDEEEKNWLINGEGLAKGPTWTRPRHLVEEVMGAIGDAQAGRRYVKFSMAKDVATSSSNLFSRVVLPSFGAAVAGTVAIGACIYKYPCEPVAPARVVSAVYGVSAAAFGAVCIGSFSFASRGLLNAGPANEEVSNCASWVRDQLKIAKIYVSVPTFNLTPYSMIEHLNYNEQNVVLG